MEKYEVLDGVMAPVSDGEHRRWVFDGHVESRRYERLPDALVDYAETKGKLRDRFLGGFATQCATDRKAAKRRGFGVAVRKVSVEDEDGHTFRVTAVKNLYTHRFTVDDWWKEHAGSIRA